ncbi:MAG: hypothetical protein K8F91_09755 [Candidatus Obscuribacterales bacterium]|nr:hypothetical protein [Candidatus Obscuribacterales bacterium]
MRPELDNYTQNNTLNDTQSVGDLIGRAARVYRSNILDWFPLLLWPTVLSAIGRAMFQGGISAFSDMPGLSSMLLLGAISLTGAIGTLIAKWILLVRQLSFVRLSNGYANSLAEALAFVKGRQWSLAGAIALMYFMIIAMAAIWGLEILASALLFRQGSLLVIASIIGIIVGFCGGTISIMFAYFAAFLVLSGIACDSADTTDLISSGFRLAGRQLWRTLLVGNLIWLAIMVLAIPFWLPIFAFLGVDALRLGPEAFQADIPIHWAILLTAWESLIDVVVWPIAFLAYGFYYYDLKLKQEGVDMMLAVDRLEAGTASGS